MTRNSNIELLRILAVMGVIVLHFNGVYGNAFDYVEQGTVNSYVLRLLESLFIPAVNIFILITGYYLCKEYERKAIKVVCLLIQVITFGGIVYLLSVLCGINSFSFSSLISAMIPCNYYVILYIVLYLISPYINLTFKGMSKKQWKVLLILSVLLFSIWPIAVDILQEIFGRSFQGLNTVGLEGDQSGYTIVQFCLMYILGGYIRANEIDASIKKSIGMIGICMCGLTVWSLLLPKTACAYCNPLVILEAVSFFLLFKRIRVSNAFINETAKATFTCFLLHGFFLRLIDTSKIVNKSLWFLLACIICLVIGIYCLCWLANIIYKFFEKYIVRTILKSLEHFTICVK